MAKAKNWLGMMFLSVFMLLLMTGLATAFIYNSTQFVSNFTTDTRFGTNSLIDTINIDLANNNQTAQNNASGTSVYQSQTQQLTGAGSNWTKIRFTWSSNDTTRLNVSVSLNNRTTWIENVTSGATYLWIGPYGNAQNFTYRVVFNGVNKMVGFYGLNATGLINISTVTNLTTQHVVHPSGYTSNSQIVEWNTTRSGNEAVTYRINDSTHFTVNGTGTVNASLNVSWAGVYSILLSACSGETCENHNFTYNLSNRAPSRMSVNLTPSANPNPGDTITCTVGSVDDDGDSVAATYYSWFIDNVESSNRLSTIVAGANQAIYCRGTNRDGNLNSSNFNSASVQVAGTQGGGGGGGGGSVSLPSVAPITQPATNVPASSAPVSTPSVASAGPVSSSLGDLKSIPLVGDVLTIVADIVDGVIAAVSNAIGGI